MLNEKEIKYYILILESDNHRLEDNISYFKRKIDTDLSFKEELEKQEIRLVENIKTIEKLENMLKELA